MIHYNSLWETMSNKHFTTYTLREKHNIGHGTVQRLQKICRFLLTRWIGCAKSWTAD